MGYFIDVHPPADAGYISLSAHHDTPWPSGAKFLEKNFALQRGRMLHGRVLDAEGNKPIEGASIVYQPLRGNPFQRNGYDMRDPVLTDKEGKFTITGLAGPGVLVAEGPGVDYIRVLMPKDPIRIREEDLFPHGFIKLDIPEKGDLASSTLLLRKGPALEAKVVGPDGSPVDWIFASCRQLNCVQINRWGVSLRFEKGLFRLTGCDPNETYRIFFINPKLHLGAVADLKFTGKPIEVRLQPTASARGKVVKPDGTAVSMAPTAMVLVAKEEGKLDRMQWYSQDRIAIYDNLTQEFGPHPKANADGTFLVENLIPGAQHYIVGGADRLVVRQPVMLKPGEVKDLGILKVAKEEP